MSERQMRMGIGPVNGKIYIIGGIHKTRPLTDRILLDRSGLHPATDTMDTRTSMAVAPENRLRGS